MRVLKVILSCLIFTVLKPIPALADPLDFLPFVSIPTLSSPRGIAVGNFFGKETLGLAVADFGSPTFIGQTTPATVLSPRNYGVQVFSASPTGLKLNQFIQTAASPRGVFAFDLSNKGKQDLLVTAYDANLLQVFSWEGDQFTKTSEQSTLTMPVGVAAGSTSSHGTLFAAVADFGSNNLSLFQIKQGKLGDRVDIPVGAGPVQVAIGNLTGDEGNEIAVGCLISHQIIILSKKGMEGDLSSYSASQTLTQPEGCEPSDLRIADINSDGKMDLVCVDFQKNLLFIYLQGKDGVLAPQAPVTTSGSHPNGLTVADLKGDGTKEVIVGNRDSDSIDLFQWSGNGLQLEKSLKVANDAVSNFGPVEIAAMDTTGQGKQDLVASHMRSNSIRVLTQAVQVASSNSTIKTQLLGSDTEGAPFSEKTTICYPNPSRDGRVKISFNLPALSPVNIQIFDISGEVVWSLNLSPSQTQAGNNTITWEGNNQAGENLASGMYLCHVTVGDSSVTKKIAILH